MPFLLNADFLLPSAREDIRKDEDWNKWLRDCVADVFVKAFESAVDNEECQMQAYSFIPLTANDEFFEPIVESIHEKLKDSEIILTQPDLKKCLPEDTMTAPKEFRSLITESYPQHLLSQRLVCPELEEFKEQLQVIGVRQLEKHDIIASLNDGKWIANQGWDWLVSCYKYLKSKYVYGLSNCPIVPIRYEDSDSVQFSCGDEQHIYFERNDETKNILSEVPPCVNVPLVFLDSKFLQLIKNDDELQSWMTKTLQIYPYSRSNYALDVTNWLKKYFRILTEEELVSVTYFLAQFDNIDDIPVLLDTGERELLSIIKARYGVQDVVTPASLDPERGWQNIFQTDGDRSHLAMLSDEYLLNDGTYIEELIEFWKNLGITVHPLPKCSIKYCYSRADTWDKYTAFNDSLTVYEQQLAEKVKPYSAFSHLTKMTIQNYMPPSTMAVQGSVDGEQLSRSMIHWLNEKMDGLDNQSWKYEKELYNCGLMLEIQYLININNSREKHFKSSFLNSLKNTSWLSTTKGFVKPDEAFLPLKQIKEILGETVPYLEEDISEEVVELLGIRNEVTAEELLDVLAHYSREQSGSKDFASRVYKYLNSVDIDKNIAFRFQKENLIYVPSHGGRWLSSRNVVWKDYGDVLGEDFAYLKKIYPELEKLFVDVLGVKVDVDIEHFAERWLTLQDKDNIPYDKMRNILSSIYTKLLPICNKEDNERPDWWRRFGRDALIWTQRNTFTDAKDVYVSDDGDLEEIFQDKNIHFAWRPEENSFSQWESLYRALKLPYLSESVDISLADEAKYLVEDEPKYLTKASKVLIATWLAEKAPDDYERLQNSNFLESLLNTQEVYSESICVVYELKLEHENVKKEREAYWVQDNKNLLLSQSSNHGKLKNMIALTLARALMFDRDHKDFANWIELTLCETNWDWRIKQHNWHVPEDVKVWLESDNSDKTGEQAVPEGKNINITSGKVEETSGERVTPLKNGEVVEPSSSEQFDFDPVKFQSSSSQRNSDNFMGEEINDSGSDELEQKAEREDSESHPDDLDYSKELRNVFSKPQRIVVMEDEEDDSYGYKKVLDINGRHYRTQEQIQEIKSSAPPQNMRYRFKSIKIWEKKNEDTRIFLREEYKGRCQICGDGFQKRDAEPYFEGLYMVSRTQASWIDWRGNVLCLCPTCCTKFQHGSVEAEDIVEQIEALRPRKEGDEGKTSIVMKLCGKECQIDFSDRHLIDLQELLKSSSKNKSS